MEKPASADHELHELIARRWSPRAFAPGPIERPLLHSVLEAARWAPSCFNEQPWRFLVAPREDQESFARMLECLVPFNQSWARDAGVLMISVAAMRFAQNDKPNPHAWHDVGLATAQMTLQATAAGLVVHQMGGFDRERVRAAYELPEGFEPVAAIAVGYPGDVDALPEELRERERAPRSRRPQAEIAFTGTWGRALPDA